MTSDQVPPAVEPPKHPWRESSAYLRDIAKWFVGGIIATAAGVLTGTSLSRLGSLNPTTDGTRLALACSGLLIAFLAIGHMMRMALGVFLVETASIDDVSQARHGQPLNSLREEIEAQFKFAEARHDWSTITGSSEALSLLLAIEQMMPFLYVRQRFKRLVRSLPISVACLVGGLVLFAWAANPPAAAPVSERGLVLKITQ